MVLTCPAVGTREGMSLSGIRDKCALSLSGSRDKEKTAVSIDEVDDMADTASSRLVTIAAWLRCNAAAAVAVVHLLAPTLPALLYR